MASAGGDLATENQRFMGGLDGDGPVTDICCKEYITQVSWETGLVEYSYLPWFVC